MKKSFIFLGLIALFGFKAKALTNYDCNQKNTKPWGCYDSRESSIGNTLYLYCWDPGEKICQFKDGTCPAMITWQDATNLVYSKVESGILQGTVDLGNGATITWDAESVSNYHYVITEQ